jgi:hypothetical protein
LLPGAIVVDVVVDVVDVVDVLVVDVDVEVVLVVDVVDVEVVEVDVVDVVVQFKERELIIISIISLMVIPFVMPAHENALPLYIIHSDSITTSHFCASGHIVVGHGNVLPSFGQQQGKLFCVQLQDI